MSGMEEQQLDLLKTFVSLCKSKPSVLHLPELSFFKSWIESLGGSVPVPEEPEPPKAEHKEPEPKAPEPEAEPEQMEPEEEVESDIELDTSCVIEADDGPPQEMPESAGEVTEEMTDACNDLCSEGQMAMGDGNLEGAVEKFTEALRKNAGSVRAWSKRASVYIKLAKPNAAHRDCDKALAINPDNAQALKWRGRANMLLGNWLEALSDLSNAQKIDYDEQCGEWLKQVMPNANKIREHNHKYQMIKEEKELQQKRERLQKAKEAREKAQQEEDARRAEEARSGRFPGGFPGGMPGGFPGGMPGGFPGGGMPGGGMPGGGAPGGGASAGMPDLSALLNDPEVLQALQDPEVMAAFQDVSSNPANMAKYKDNPKVKKVIEKLTAKFGGAGGGSEAGDMPSGMPGGMPGGFPGGFPSGMPGFQSSQAPPSSGGSTNPPSSSFDVD